jgi:RNA-directed DNA polymerase
MTKQKEEKPVRVPKEANPTGEIRSKWLWTEPTVWTDRMLTALEKGVKGGRWFSLIDKVYSMENLEPAFRKVSLNRGTAGSDYLTIEMYENRLVDNLEKVSKLLKEGKYQPQKIKRVWIPKPGSKEKRPLGIPTVQDRVVQTALRNVLEPIFEKDFADNSYGFRPNRSCKDALRKVDRLLKSGKIYVLDADIQSYFDTISHDKLMELIKAKVSDNRVLNLIEKFLKQEVLEGLEKWTPDKGSPQGAVISPLLSNIYLDPLDHMMIEKGYELVRYADDFVILCDNQDEAEKALKDIQEWLNKADLKLNMEKTRIVNANETAFEFLGYRFEKGRRWPRKKSLKKLKDKIKEKTKRTNGHSLLEIVSNINKVLKGWFEYYKHSHKYTFGSIDSWIRMRLRSILRKRIGLTGRGRGRDHKRWPNVFFKEQGLFSLVTAHAELCQSSKR